MKFLFATIAAFALQACETIPIKAQACYVTKGGQQVCVGTDGQSITIDGTFRSQK